MGVVYKTALCEVCGTAGACRASLPAREKLARSVVNKQRPIKRLNPVRPILTLLLTVLAAGHAATPSPEFGRQHWAFQRLTKPAIPPVKDSRWPRNEVDRFILAALEAKSLKPSAETDRRTLIRRASFDLLGLPPTPEEVEAFVQDTSPQAWERVVDRLLASPHYGERWGRHWLDLARYADSSGFHNDLDRPHAWRYRDYDMACTQLPGEETHKDRFKFSQVLAFNHEVVSPRDAASGQATGMRQHMPFRVVIPHGSNTPLLFKAIANNEIIPKVEFQFFRQTQVGTEVLYMKYELENVIVSSVRPWLPNVKEAAVANFGTQVEVSFVYQKITWTFINGGVTATDSWNQNKAQ